jgi:uncharacterized protein with PIN domain
MNPRLESPESFDVDGMLGKLAKWLRILGFDAEYPCRAPSQGRLFVTAARRPQRPGVIIVHASDCLEQLRSVLEQAEVGPDPELFLSRCLLCNVPVCETPRESVRDVVPEPIFARVTQFNQCPVCRRVYWDGSHGIRIKYRLKQRGIGLD